MSLPRRVGAGCASGMGQVGQVAVRSRGVKGFRHPMVGDLTLDWASRTCAGDPVFWSTLVGNGP